jgi:uncharacterized protein YcfJ
MKKVLILILLLGLTTLYGCTTTQKGAGIGAAGGAGLGAIIGHQSGHTAEGAAIGAAAGGLTGALVGEQMDRKFCPTCGRTFPSDVEFCPYDGTELQWKQ